MIGKGEAIGGEVRARAMPPLLRSPSGLSP